MKSRVYCVHLLLPYVKRLSNEYYIDVFFFIIRSNQSIFPIYLWITSEVSHFPMHGMECPSGKRQFSSTHCEASSRQVDVQSTRAFRSIFRKSSVSSMIDQKIQPIYINLNKSTGQEIRSLVARGMANVPNQQTTVLSPLRPSSARSMNTSLYLKPWTTWSDRIYLLTTNTDLDVVVHASLSS